MSARTTIVTAADSRYGRSLFQLLLSASRHAPRHHVVVFDLGLNASHRALLAARFATASVVPFDFAASPAHVRDLYTCAWKPAAIEQVLNERGGATLWLDAASIVHAPLDPVFATIARDGVLSLAGQSPARRWCHPATFAVMGVPEEDRDKRCRAGGVLGFDGSRSDVRALVSKWREWAFDRDCINPAGASRANHRYDQALLTNLLHAAARERRFVLQDADVDVSAIAPVDWVSTRNSVPEWIPLAADPVVRAWYRVMKGADRALLRARARFREGSYPPGSVRTARR